METPARQLPWTEVHYRPLAGRKPIKGDPRQQGRGPKELSGAILRKLSGLMQQNFGSVRALSRLRKVLEKALGNAFGVQPSARLGG